MPASPALSRRPVRGTVAACVAAALALVLAGCGLRLETPPPEPLVPDATEAARQRTVADATALRTLAGVAAGDAEEAVAAALAAVVDVSGQHVDALGGVYVPTPSPSPAVTPAPDDAAPTGEPSAAATATPPPAAAVEAADVVALLDEAAASARADAAEVEDRGLARLLAAIATSRLLLADRLAPVAGADRPERVPAEVPEELPAGLPTAWTDAVVQSHDATGMAWEVVAARAADDARGAAADRARGQRARGQAWADLAAVSGTGLDPRRSAYDLPAELTAPTDADAARAAVLGLEQALAAQYATGVGSVDAGSRTALLDGLADAARVGWPDSTPAFPGMPDLAS